MRKKIKLLYVISTLRPCGPVNVLYNIIKYIDLAVFSVLILTLAPEGLQTRLLDFEQLGVKVISLRLSRLGMQLWGRNRLIDLVGKLNPDIINTHCFRSTIYSDILAKQYAVCVTVHNYPEKDFVFEYGKFVGNLMCNKYISSLKKIRNIIPCSESISNYLLDKYGLKSFFIRNGVDTIDYQASSISEKILCRKKLMLPEKAKIFISIGTLHERKDPLFLIKMFNKLNIAEECILVFLGDGTLREKCKGKSGMNIILRGKVNNVHEYLKAADVFISASRAEGMPNAVLEALAAGLPAILSNIEPHSEIKKLSHGAVEVYEMGDYDDCIEKIYKILEEDYSILSKKAMMSAEQNFCAKMMSVNYQKIYQRLMRNFIND
ncbi:glycosyltransferase family 4 protein [Pectinatus frisingensis]|uniref:glycosyltransferase family 4 protein n=1 Tax=Pectinatus frisingensis TaxID=865 RepID=UPI0018C67022|nr:glycosyltransferase family 4 protein [Pectinatus frisingensis]